MVYIICFFTNLIRFFLLNYSSIPLVLSKPFSWVISNGKCFISTGNVYMMTVPDFI
jgi:hypothetical protein